jgi:2-keto-3-deoxy-L-rhamnonate aldolase RhmA
MPLEMPLEMKKLKERLLAGETLVGCFLNLGSSLTAEIMGRAGFDFAVVDLEHGSGTEADVLSQLQALEATGCGAVVRVESHHRQRAHRVLDLGAEGIMFPRVDSASGAAAAVAGLRYPPEVRLVAAGLHTPRPVTKRTRLRRQVFSGSSGFLDFSRESERTSPSREKVGHVPTVTTLRPSARGPRTP